jgi:hypothetical protein
MRVASSTSLEKLKQFRQNLMHSSSVGIVDNSADLSVDEPLRRARAKNVSWQQVSYDNEAEFEASATAMIDNRTFPPHQKSTIRENSKIGAQKSSINPFLEQSKDSRGHDDRVGKSSSSSLRQGFKEHDNPARSNHRQIPLSSSGISGRPLVENLASSAALKRQALEDPNPVGIHGKTSPPLPTYLTAFVEDIPDDEEEPDFEAVHKEVEEESGDEDGERDEDVSTVDDDTVNGSEALQDEPHVDQGMEEIKEKDSLSTTRVISNQHDEHGDDMIQSEHVQQTSTTSNGLIKDENSFERDAPAQFSQPSMHMDSKQERQERLVNHDNPPTLRHQSFPDHGALRHHPYEIPGNHRHHRRQQHHYDDDDDDEVNLSGSWKEFSRSPKVPEIHIHNHFTGQMPHTAPSVAGTMMSEPLHPIKNVQQETGSNFRGSYNMERIERDQFVNITSDGFMKDNIRTRSINRQPIMKASTTDGLRESIDLSGLSLQVRTLLFSSLHFRIYDLQLHFIVREFVN